MRTREVRCDLRWLLGLILFFLLFQLFGSTLSVFNIAFGALLSSAFLAALVVSYALMRKTGHTLTLSGPQMWWTGISTAVASSLFVLRLNWHLFDLFCPTGLLGAVTRISKGKFPASFMSFPDFPMNYHQGFMFIAGALSHVTGLPPATSINVVYIVSFVLIVVTLSLYFIEITSRYYLLPVALLIVVSSVSPQYFLDLGWANYVNVFEYLTSNSWPFAVLAILFLLFLLRRFEHSTADRVCAFLVALSLSTINATVFSVLLFTSILSFALNLRALVTDREGRKLAALYVMALAGLALIPRYLPSAFLVGDTYEAPRATIRLLAFGFPRYALNMGRYVFLSNPLVLIALVHAVTQVRAGRRGPQRFASLFLLTSFMVPVVVAFSNIDSWDNLHKFALLNILLSIIVMVTALSEDAASLSRKRILIAIGVCVLLSSMADYDLFRNRTSLEFNRFAYPGRRIRDVVVFLESNGARKNTLVPFRNDSKDLCDEAGPSAIAQYAGYSMKYSYFPNFLLAEALETQVLESARWAESQDTFSATVKALRENEYIIVANENKEAFRQMMKAANLGKSERETIEFSGYFLY